MVAVKGLKDGCNVGAGVLTLLFIIRIAAFGQSGYKYAVKSAGQHHVALPQGRIINGAVAGRHIHQHIFILRKRPFITHKTASQSQLRRTGNCFSLIYGETAAPYQLRIFGPQCVELILNQIIRQLIIITAILQRLIQSFGIIRHVHPVIPAHLRLRLHNSLQIGFAQAGNSKLRRFIGGQIVHALHRGAIVIIIIAAAVISRLLRPWRWHFFWQILPFGRNDIGSGRCVSKFLASGQFGIRQNLPADKLFVSWRCESTLRQDKANARFRHNIRHFTTAAISIKLHSHNGIRQHILPNRSNRKFPFGGRNLA